jgi:hypothetical protein
VKAIQPKAVGTTGALNGSLSGVIDTLGYRGVEFIYGYGTSAAVTDVITPVVLESDTTGGTFTSVADADLVGTESEARYPAVTGRTSGVSQNFFSKLGYKGNKRYLKTRMYGVGTATAIVSAVAVLHTPRHAPAA